MRVKKAMAAAGRGKGKGGKGGGMRGRRGYVEVMGMRGRALQGKGRIGRSELLVGWEGR